MMKIPLPFVALLFMLPAGSLGAASKDDAEIQSLIKTFAAASNALDLDGTMACYSNKPEVSVFSPRPSKPIVGLAAIRKNWSDFFAILKSNHSELSGHSKLSDIAIESDGSLAFTYFTTTEEIAMKDGTTVKPSLRSTIIFQKINGHWLIIHEHNPFPAKGERQAQIHHKDLEMSHLYYPM